MTVAEKLEARGYQEGFAKGRKEAKIVYAFNLFNMGMSLDVVTKATGLSIGDLEQLGAQMN